MGRDAGGSKYSIIIECNKVSNVNSDFPDKHPAMFDFSEFTNPTVESKRQFSVIHSRLWTEHKARLISEYLKYFVYITRHGTYIDGFAGPQYLDKTDSWAAQLVLDNEPRWLRSFFLCDSDPKQYQALEKLRDSQAEIENRMVKVKHADFNLYVDTLLKTSDIRETTATFCLLDQRTFECNWFTVQKIAKYKRKTKIEIFYFIPTGWLARSISGLQDPESRMLQWWGRDDWKALKGMSNTETAQVFRRRFLDELGYKYADLWPIYETQSSKRIMYYMLHASDHDEAPKQMHRAYKNITRRSIRREQYQAPTLPLFS